MTAPLTVVPPATPAEASSAERIRAVFQKQRARRWQLVEEGAKERRARLVKLRAAVLARREAIKEALFQDFKKPHAETESTEILVFLMEVHDAIKNVKRWMRPRKVKTPMLFAGTRSHVRYEPKGQVLVLGPFNYPFQLIVGPLVGALAAGNTVMIKPSEKTPATSRLLAELVRDTFDESEVALFEGGTEVAQALLDLPFDHLFFTGGPKVGRIVMQAAAKHLASVTLELGGKSPAIVDASADVKTAAERIVWGRFVNAGQTCIAPDYVLVHRSREAALLEAMQGALERFYGKDAAARRASPDYARLVDDGAFRRISGLLERTRAAGARVVAGGETDAAERYIAPTILAGVTPDMAVMEEEIFGPLLPVLPFDALEDVLTHVRAGGKPLALYVFAQDEAVVKRVVRGTSAGGTVINNTLLHCAQGTLPFGGTGESGIGNYHGEWGFKTFSHERAVMRQGRTALANLFFPPYTKHKQRMGRLSARLFE